MHSKQRFAAIALFGGLTVGLLATTMLSGDDPAPVTAQAAAEPTYCCVAATGECEQIGGTTSSSDSPATTPEEDEAFLDEAAELIPEMLVENMRTVLNDVGARTYPYVHKQIRGIREALDALPDDPQEQVTRIRALFDETIQLQLFHQMYAEAAEFIPNRRRDLQQSIDNMNQIIDDRNFYSCWAWRASVCRSEDAQRDNFVSRLSVTNREASNIFSLAYETNDRSTTQSMSELRRSYAEITTFGSSGLRDVFRAEGEATAAWVRAADNTITGLRWTRTAISLALTVYPPGQKLFDGISNGMDILTGQVTVEEGLTNAAIDLAAGRAVGVGGRLLARVGPRGVARILTTAARNNPRMAAAVRNALENIATDAVGNQIRAAYDELRGTNQSSSTANRPDQEPVGCTAIDARYSERAPFRSFNQCRAACRLSLSTSSSSSSSSSDSSEAEESSRDSDQDASASSESRRSTPAGTASSASGGNGNPGNDGATSSAADEIDEDDYIPFSPADCIRYGRTEMRSDPRWECDPLIRGWL